MRSTVVMVVALFATLAFAAGAAAESPQFVLEQIGMSTLTEPTGETFTSMVWSLKLGAPELSERMIVLGLEVEAAILTPASDGRWVRGKYRALGAKNQVRLELIIGGLELLPESLRSIDPALVSEVAVYPTGIRVNFRSGVTAAQIRASGLVV